MTLVPSARLAGKVAAITGGASGIGLAMVKRFLAEGAQVIAADVHDVALIDTSGENLLGVRCDVSVADDVAALVAICRDRFGRLDVVCANAGIRDPHKALADLTIEEWDAVMAVNLRGTYLTLRYTIPSLIDGGGGAIVVTASGAGLRPPRHNAAYSVAKAGAIMLAKAAAVDYASCGVRVNAILPGATDTPLLRTNPPERIASLSSSVPLGRLAEPDEIAALALFWPRTRRPTSPDRPTRSTGATRWCRGIGGAALWKLAAGYRPRGELSLSRRGRDGATVDN
jgi:NAD(P)-dependent dehydrogenase (short-subunit alcohol dehydrogenase family)